MLFRAGGCHPPRRFRGNICDVSCGQPRGVAPTGMRGVQRCFMRATTRGRPYGSYCFLCCFVWATTWGRPYGYALCSTLIRADAHAGLPLRFIKFFDICTPSLNAPARLGRGWGRPYRYVLCSTLMVFRDGRQSTPYIENFLSSCKF